MKMLILLIFLTIFTARSDAQEISNTGLMTDAKSKKVTLEWIISQYQQNNLEAKMLSNVYLASSNMIRVEGSLEDPVIGTEYNFAMDDIMATARIMLPFFGKTELQKKIALENSYINWHQLQDKKLLNLSLVKMMFWQYWMIYQEISVFHENIDLMKRFRKIAENQYTSGKAAQMDVVKAGIEIALMEKMLLETRKERDSVEAQLNEMIGMDPYHDLGSPVIPSYQLELNTGWDINTHPKLQKAESALKKSIKELDREYLDWLPDLMLGAKYGFVSGAQIMAEIGVPLFFDTRLGKIDQLAGEKKAMEYSVKMDRLSLLADYKKLVSDYITRTNVLALFEGSLNLLTKQGLELAESGYITGKSGFLDLLDNQRNYLNNKLDYLKAMGEAGMAAARIEYILGVGN